MSYWTGLTEEKKNMYEAEFKNKAFLHEFFNSFKIIQCHTHEEGWMSHPKCNQTVILKLINDPLSNSSGFVYAGKCCNGHWSQMLPVTPYDVKNIPRCEACGSIMQWKNGWICVFTHDNKK